MRHGVVGYLLVVGCFVALAVATGSSGSGAGTNSGSGSYPRTNRGFKSQGLSTARGFGKRDPNQGLFLNQNSIDSFLTPTGDIRTNYPTSWLIEELQNNPEAARLIVEKIVDENGDGELSPEELFRRLYY